MKTQIRMAAASCLMLIFGTMSTSANALDFKAKQAFLIDHSTGTVLLNRAGSERMFPSSMTKLMTVYIVFDKIKQGALTMDSTLPVSEAAWRMGGSKMFVQVGDQVRVEDLLHGIIIQSGNDACMVVAEALGGSEDGFAQLMNETAAKMGLKNTHFMNSTGWPDENHYTTAEDLATISAHLIDDFPDLYPYFSLDSFTYSGITQPNRNLLLHRGIGVDGLKTGHTEIAGYGITLSAINAEGRRLILVINGLGSDKERASEGEILLGYGFREFESLTLLHAGQEVDNLPVWLGAQDTVELTAPSDVKVTLPRSGRDSLKYILKAKSPIAAPIAKGTQLATLEVRQGDSVLMSVPLIAADDVAEAGFFKRVQTAFGQLIGR